ncbi:MAG: hypothetical protein LAP87_22915 [Acidobacteriia bacterium]|nr:hypothetical protein [Terriglobia bacterium]
MRSETPGAESESSGTGLSPPTQRPNEFALGTIEISCTGSRERNRWRDVDLSVETGLANEDDDGGDDLSSAQLEAEITATIHDRLPGIFIADDLIGVGVWLWKVRDLRDRMDPSSGRYSEPFSRRWNQTTGPIRGFFPDDWEISGTLEVND